MTILDNLLSKLGDDAPVRSILVGAHWTAVCSRSCGLASTLIDDHPHGHAQVQDAGRLHLKSARELADYARSDQLLEASIGVAALNSLLDVDETQVSLVHQRRRLQRMIRSLLPHVTLRQTMELIVDERHQSVEGRTVALGPSPEEFSGSVVGIRRHDSLSGSMAPI